MELRQNKLRGCSLDIILMLVAPVLFQSWQVSPYWLVATSALWTVFRIPLALRKQLGMLSLHAGMSKPESNYNLWVKPFFTGLPIALLVYGASYAVHRWLF